MNRHRLKGRRSRRICFLFVSVITMVIASAPASAADDDPFSIAVGFDSPTAYWRLNDPQGAHQAEEENGGSWILRYAGTAHTFGQPGAIAASTNAAVRLGESSTVRSGELTNIATVELWAKLLSRPSYTRQLLRETDVFNDFVRSIDVAPDGRVESFRHETDPDTRPASVDTRAASVASEGMMRHVLGPTIDIANGAWHHIVAVYAGSVSQVYVDGTPGPLLGGTVSPVASAMSVQSIPEPQSIFGFDDVVLDDIALYPRALDEDRVIVHSQARYDAPDDVSIGDDGEVFDVSAMAVGDEETDSEFEYFEDVGPWNAGANPPLGDTPLTLVNPTTGPIASAVTWISLPGFNCTGFVIGRRAIATAAHCVFAENPSTPKRGRELIRPTSVTVARNVLDDSNPAPFGTCEVLRKGIFIPGGFLRRDWTGAMDYAVLRLDCDLQVRNPDRYQSVCVARDLTSTLAEGTRSILQGYPADPPGTTAPGTQWNSIDKIRNNVASWIRTHNGLAPGMSGGPFYRTRTSSRCSRPVFGILHGTDGAGYTAGAQIKLPVLRNLNRWKTCDLTQRRRRCGAAGGN